MDSYQQLCMRCGNTFGSHCADSRGPACPASEGRMDWMRDKGVMIFFVPSGIYEKPEETERRRQLAWEGMSLYVPMTPLEIEERLAAGERKAVGRTNGDGTSGQGGQCGGSGEDCEVL